MEIKLKDAKKPNVKELELVETKLDFCLELDGELLMKILKDGSGCYAYQQNAEDLGFKDIDFD